MRPVILIHGGFFSEAESTDTIRFAKQAALRTIVSDARSYLYSHSAVQTAIYAVSLLEDNELFNAGTGSQIQSDGRIRMSASVMDGSNKKFAGVINIENVKNPIFVAEKLLRYEDSVLSGAEASRFAWEMGFEFFNPETVSRRQAFLARKAEEGRKGTVGCVVLDEEGRLAAATSTGGKGFELPGRVSDSATVAGNYADNHAAVSCTGVGEDIVSAALAARIVTRTADGFSIKEAVEKSMNELKTIDGFAGVVGISVNGDSYHADSHPYMVWASYSDTLDVF